MVIGSLFSGAGGLDMAVQAVFGGEVVWHAEIDTAASKVLAHRFPGVPNLGSVTDIDWAAVPAVDVLCGGFPCQDVSAAGKRAGIKAGTRSGLWSVFADAIDALRPTWVVIENVRGLLSATAHRTVGDDADGDVEPAAGVMGDGAGRPVLRAAGAVLGDLADLGYDAQWATVAAADVGAPHRRERVFILASHANPDQGGRGGWREAPRGDVGRHDQIDGQRGSFPAARRSGTASDSSCNGRDEGRPEPARIVRGFDAALGGDENGVALLPTPTAQAARHGAESRYRAEHPGEVSNLWQIAYLLPTPVSRDHKGRNQRDDETCLPGALSALDPVNNDAELWPVIRNAIGYEYGRQRSNGMTPMFADDIDLDGLANAATEAVKDFSGPLRAQGNADSIGQPPESGPGSPPLLQTPSVADSTGGHLNRSGERKHEQLLAGQAREMSAAWGKYEPAIRRWEAIVGPAPAPTEPNKNGNPRLSAAFSEWLMGWPAGWVTDPAIGISRNDQLRIVGNGVCPQQAAAALRYLLGVAAGKETGA